MRLFSVGIFLYSLFTLLNELKFYLFCLHNLNNFLNLFFLLIIYSVFFLCSFFSFIISNKRYIFFKVKYVVVVIINRVGLFSLLNGGFLCLFFLQKSKINLMVNFISLLYTSMCFFVLYAYIGMYVVHNTIIIIKTLFYLFILFHFIYYLLIVFCLKFSDFYL